MKTLVPRYRLLVTVCALLAGAANIFAQGALTPPGAPAPTMKSLDQIEARTPISSAPFTISSPGSYYLTTNITVSTGNAININASGVTLDLNGFTISSTAVSANGSGILLATGLTDITVLNGHIKGGVTYSGGVYAGGGFSGAIAHSNPLQPFNVRVANVSISGCAGSGIFLGTDNSTVVDSCTVLTVGGYGIEAASVVRSSAYQCGLAAIIANIASDCYGYSTGGDGLNISHTANNCYGYSAANNGTGLSAVSANNCYGYSTGGPGTGLSASSANNCYGESLTDIGLQAGQANSCYGLSESDNTTGLIATTAVNCYGKCLAPGNGSGTGVNAYIAIGCYGFGAVGGLSNNGLNATIANSCYSNTGDGGITNKYNMP